ncbi:small heat shock protein, chloroplastic-like [Triticum dicoccoides]|uniref:small heat shock protein, chloroplastic-like n=1 Tax=Triticum dicoccoides TaxID=85692 RepID=UPI000E794639|nr:small heat shock protein, chloroplastic-like [Triticum dicoccoides]
MLQAVVSNPQPVAASLGLGTPCHPGRGSVRVRSTRNGSADNLDHLRRPPTATARQPRQGNGNPAPRRRVIQTSPFGLWDSFPDARTLDQMMRTMERIMDEADDDDGRRPFVVPGATVPPTAARRADDRRGRTPWEIKERAGDYLVRFDMPGMTREDVRVSVQDRTLVVVAEKAAKQREAVGEKDKDNEEDGEEEEAWPAASYGRYRTRVELPENVEVESIAAVVRDGVLYLSIPKVSPSGGKVVSIQVQ